MLKNEVWTIAYRKRNGDKCILDDTAGAFSVLPNTIRYWRADPFLFEKDGKTYLFAEMYDFLIRRGVIGYCELTQNGATEWMVCLKMPFHLSYPFVFEFKNKIYMIPETYVANEIALYESVDFPSKWKRVKALKDDFCAVDTTLYEIDGQKWMITLKIQDSKDVLTLIKLNNDNLEAQHTRSISEYDNVNVRPAGRLFIHKGSLIRPAQDCSAGYGCAINFYEVNEMNEEKYSESLIRKIYTKELTSDFKMKAEGVHTYNLSSQYEVVDFKSYEFNLLSVFTRIFWAIFRRLQKLLGR